MGIVNERSRSDLQSGAPGERGVTLDAIHLIASFDLRDHCRTARARLRIAAQETRRCQVFFRTLVRRIFCRADDFVARSARKDAARPTLPRARQEPATLLDGTRPDERGTRRRRSLAIRRRGLLVPESSVESVLGFFDAFQSTTHDILLPPRCEQRGLDVPDDGIRFFELSMKISRDFVVGHDVLRSWEQCDLAIEKDVLAVCLVLSIDECFRERGVQNIPTPLDVARHAVRVIDARQEVLSDAGAACRVRAVCAGHFLANRRRVSLAAYRTAHGMWTCGASLI